jgi:hypothetical protein
MAKISKHGGPSVEPDAAVRITRPEVGSPVVSDISEAAQADQEVTDEQAEQETAQIAAEETKTSPRPRKK